MSESINSNNKANYSKFVVDNSYDGGVEGKVYAGVPGKEAYGQQQFGVIGHYDPINCDPTRDTENDAVATELISGGRNENYVDDEEKSGQF